MLGFGHLQRKVSNYILLVLACAVLLSLFLLSDPYPPTIASDQLPLVILTLTFLGLLAELRPVSSLSGDKRTVIASVYVCTILLIGSGYAVLVVLLTQVGHHLTSRMPFPKFVFNASQLILAVGISGIAYETLVRSLSRDDTPAIFSTPGILALLALFFIYYGVNSLMVAIVVALDTATPIRQFYDTASLDHLSVSMGELVVGVIAAMLWLVNPLTLGLVALMVVIIYRGFALSASLQLAQHDLLLRMKELQRRTTELELLSEVNHALTRAIGPNELWELLAEQVGRIIDTTCFVIALVEEHQHSRRLRIVFAQDGEKRDEGQLIPEGTSFSSIVVESARPIIVSDFQSEKNHYPTIIPYGTEKIPLSIIAVPLILDGKVLGAVSAQTYRVGAYGAEDLGVLQAIASQAAIAVNSARLREAIAETEALKRLNLLKTEFLSTVSHELRSPLTPIFGYAEMLATEEHPSQSVQDMAIEISRSATRMATLVDDLLDLSRIESGRLKLKRAPIALDILIEKAIKEYRITSPEHTFVIDSIADPPPAHADSARVRQVLDNLIGNAIKYSPVGTTITVLLRGISLSDGEGGDGSDGDEARELSVSVKDEGPGIAPEKMGRLFEMFYRVDSELTRRVHGSGVGLAISKQIVEIHNGRVWVESEPGRGSVFSFSLPIATADAVQYDERESVVGLPERSRESRGGESCSL